MKVLLCEDVRKLGYFGDVVEVAEGYARNYLLPRRLAIVPSETNLKSLADEKAKRAEQRIQQRKHLEAAAEKVKGAEAVISAKANEQGHLFGSVAGKDIAANLRAQGFEVADDIVALHGHIKEVGTHTVNLEFADDIVVPVTVVVVAAGEPVPAEGAENIPASQKLEQTDSAGQEN
jgi:large subunit ribosomal protein L9